MSGRNIKSRKALHRKNGVSPKNGVVQSNGTHLQHDHELVQRCLKGDVAGWQELFEQCQPHLLVTIQSLLRPYGRNINLAEEIASRVWFSLIGANGKLLARYDVQRGCQLTTFIAALARHELLMYWRTEKRQRKREQSTVRRRSKHREAQADIFNVVWGEFVETLTDREREFLEQVLIVPPTEHRNGHLSQSNQWQLSSRVLAKLRQYSANAID